MEISGSGVYGFQVTVTRQDDGGTGGDAGADLGSASPVSAGTISGMLGDDDYTDVYVFKAPRHAVMSIESSEPVGEVVALGPSLSYNGGSEASLDLTPGAAESTWAVLLNEADELVYLTVIGLGTYDMSIAANTQPDGDDGTGDAPGVAVLAKEISSGDTFEGWLGGDDGRDFYAFTPQLSGSVTVGLEFDSDFTGYGQVDMRSQDNAAVFTLCLDAWGTGKRLLMLRQALPTFLKSRRHTWCTTH